MKPTISFIIPIQEQQQFLIEQLNAIFKFSECYHGFCEIITPTTDLDNPKLNLIKLAIKLNKVSHPHVRTRQLYFTQKMDLKNLIEIGLSQALGDKIVIVLNIPENVENLEIKNFTDKNIIITQYMVDTDTLQDVISD